LFKIAKNSLAFHEESLRIGQMNFRGYIFQDGELSGDFPINNLENFIKELNAVFIYRAYEIGDGVIIVEI
jgi:hypothetical protein